MKINVYFEANNQKKLIATVSSLYEAQQKMKEKIKNMNFKSHYTRVTFESDTRVWLDYGSHTKFFSFELSDSKRTFISLYNDSYQVAVLKQLLEEYIDERLFSLYSYSEEAICMEQDKDDYLVYIGEKGQKHNLKRFQYVNDACCEIIHQLSESDEEENNLIKLFLEKAKY